MKAKWVGKTVNMKDPAAKAMIPKGPMYKGKEVMNDAESAIGKGPMYKGAEVQAKQPVKRVKPRKAIAQPKTPSHTMSPSGPSGSEAMYG